MIEEQETAQYWVRKAHAEAVAAVQAECSAAGHISVGRINVSQKQLTRGAFSGAWLVAAAVLVALSVAFVAAFGGPVGILGALGAGAFMWILLSLVNVGGRGARAAESAALKPYSQRLANVRELDRWVDDVVLLASKMGVAGLSSYSIRTDEATLTIAYL